MDLDLTDEKDNVWANIATWIEIFELIIFALCGWMCYKKLLNFNMGNNKNDKSHIIDYRCRFFKALMLASIIRSLTLLAILIIGKEKKSYEIGFLVKELNFTFPCLLWVYCYSIVVDLFVSLYQKLLERNIYFISQIYYFIYWVVCIIYVLMIIEAGIKINYIFFVNNSRIMLGIIYFVTALGLIYFGLNLVYEIYKDCGDENDTKTMMEKILIFISLCVGIFLTTVVLDILIGFNALDIESTKHFVEALIILLSELLPLLISLAWLKDKKPKNTNINEHGNWEKTDQVDIEMKSRLLE